MPCMDSCYTCGENPCKCAEADKFDYEGALCDVLSLIEAHAPKLLKKVDKMVLAQWQIHSEEEREKIQTQALAKLTPREKRALGLK